MIVLDWNDPKILSIVGSRTFNDYETLKEIVNKVLSENNYDIMEIVSGGAKGADSLAERYANENNIHLTVYKADWEKYGKRAGFIRNVDIIKHCNICIAFWDGESRGTLHDINLCKEHNKKCFVYNFITKELKLHE